MRIFLTLMIVLLFVSCTSQATIPQPTVTRTPMPEPTSTVEATQRVEVTLTVKPTLNIEPNETAKMDNITDLSGVELFEATHLMDPSYFQIVLENWPREIPETVQVFVDDDEYTCDVLFPDQYPERNYCWGTAPKRGSQVIVMVRLPGESAPVLVIPFVVPSPGSGGDG